MLNQQTIEQVLGTGQRPIPLKGKTNLNEVLFQGDNERWYRGNGEVVVDTDDEGLVMEAKSLTVHELNQGDEQREEYEDWEECIVLLTAEERTLWLMQHNVSATDKITGRRRWNQDGFDKWREGVFQELIKRGIGWNIIGDVPYGFIDSYLKGENEVNAARRFIRHLRLT